ncbi:MAG TPA: hypothetical protein VHB98_00175, partial [Chloroflexota bacterium]|nr:hypothetical protein [Chloroflexota bacterium]
RPGQASRAPRQIAAVPPPDMDGDGQEAEAPSALQAKARSVGDDARGEASQRAEGTGPATAQQIDRLVKLQAALGRPKQAPEGLSFEEAAHQIIELVRIFNAQARGGRQSQAR